MTSYQRFSQTQNMKLQYLVQNNATYACLFDNFISIVFSQNHHVLCHIRENNKSLEIWGLIHKFTGLLLSAGFWQNSPAKKEVITSWILTGNHLVKDNKLFSGYIRMPSCKCKAWQPAFKALLNTGDKNYFVPDLLQKMVTSTMKLLAGRLFSSLHCTTLSLSRTQYNSKSSWQLKAGS